jgi:hypothetical protein
MSRLHQKMKKIDEEQRGLKEDDDFASVFRQEIQDAEWVRDAGLQVHTCIVYLLVYTLQT